MLARYTCIALQRLNGSQKKVKGSLLDKTLRYGMDNPIFHQLREAVEHPSRSRDWFGLAEQAINTVYALGEHPDAWCDDLIKRFTKRAFDRKQKAGSQSQSQSQSQSPSRRQSQGEGEGAGAEDKEKDPDAMDEDDPPPVSTQSTGENGGTGKDVGDAFELSQLIFIVGHVAIKQIVFLELVEREWKRQKDEKQIGRFSFLDLELSQLLTSCWLADKQATKGNDKTKDEAEELDQVAGNAEDEIGERIAAVRETELLYGSQSLLALYGPLVVYICGNPQKFKVNHTGPPFQRNLMETHTFL